MIHPHLPVRIPCYDLVLIADLALDPLTFTLILNVCLFSRVLFRVKVRGTSGAANFAGLTGSVYKRRERIHRGLLIRDYYRFRLHGGELQPPIRTEGRFEGLAHRCRVATRCPSHCRMCVALDVSAMMT